MRKRFADIIGVIYRKNQQAAESLALATLEVFVHTESDRIPLVAIRGWIQDDSAIASYIFKISNRSFRRQGRFNL